MVRVPFRGSNYKTPARFMREGLYLGRRKFIISVSQYHISSAFDIASTNLVFDTWCKVTVTREMGSQSGAQALRTCGVLQYRAGVETARCDAARNRKFGLKMRLEIPNGGWW